MRGGGAVLRLLGVVGWEVTRPVKPRTNGKTVKRDSKGRIQKGSAPLNPFGAPKRGDSWAETLKRISEMDGPDIAAMWDTQHKEFSKLPQGISVKMLMSLTVVASLLREPSPGLWKEYMERAECKVKDVIDMTVSEKIFKVDIDDDGQDQNTDQAENLQ